jgi:hypothetical protein
MKQYLKESTITRINDLGHAFEKLREDLSKLHPSIYADAMNFHSKKSCTLADMVNTWVNYAILKGNDAALQHICRFYDLDPLAVKAGAKDLTERSGPMTATEVAEAITTKHSNIQTGEPQGDVSSGLEATLQQRGQTHGDYTDHARITQKLKNIVQGELLLRDTRGQDKLSHCAEESLDMILHKIGRIIAGQWDEPDHWQDIAGYATITEKRIKK